MFDPTSPLTFESSIIRVRLDKTKANPGFYFDYFRSPIGRSRIRAIVSGATVKGIRGSDLRLIKVHVPPLNEQIAIRAVVTAYDDLIATNQRRIQLLDDAARHLYREWFVHLRYPGHELVTVKDGLPNGWAKMQLGELAHVVMGQSPESKFYNSDGDGLPFHQGVSDFGDRFVVNTTFTTQSPRIAEADDILCSVRAPVGRLNITSEKIAIGRGLSAMRSNMNMQSLLFYQLKALFTEEDMIGGGAIFASVCKKELLSQELVQPDSLTAIEFNRIANENDRQIETLAMQNRSLAKIRDLILHKLMSGQLDVSGITLPDEVVT